MLTDEAKTSSFYPTKNFGSSIALMIGSDAIACSMAGNPQPQRLCVGTHRQFHERWAFRQQNVNGLVCAQKENYKGISAA